MNETLTAFLDNLRLHLAETTASRKAYEIKRFADYLDEAKKDFTAISKEDIEQYLLSFPVTRWTRLAICCAIREYYAFIKAPVNPAKGITFLPAKRQRLFRLPGRIDINRALARLAVDESPQGLRNRLMVELAYGSGLRRIELARLNIEDVDQDARTVRVLGKGDRERIVPVTDKALEVMRAYLACRPVARGPLFISFMGRRMQAASTYYIIRDASGIRPHLWRHACATHMLAAGCNLRVIQELLGHKRLTTAVVYTHITREDLRGKILSAHPRAKA